MTPPEQRAKEIVCAWAGTDQSNQPLENLIQAVAAALTEAENKHGELCEAERDELALQAAIEINKLRERVSELEAHLRRDHAQDCGIFSRKECSCGWNQGTFNADDERDRQWLEEHKQAARIEGLRRAKDLCQKQVHAIQCIMAIDAEIAALASPTDNTDTREQQRLERGKELK